MISWILFTAVFIRCSLIQDVKGQTKPDCNLKIGQKCALKYSTSFLMVGDERWIPGIGDRVVEVRSINGDTVEVAGASKTGTAPCSELVDLDHAEDFFKKESMRLPDSMFPQTTLAFCMRAQGDLNLAVSYLSQAIDKRHDNLELILARTMFNLERRDYDAVILDSERALTLDPTCSLAYRRRGLALESKGDFDGAINEFTSAIKVDSHDWESHVLRAWRLVNKNENAAAIADYTDAIKINPKSAWAYTGRGIARYRRGDFNRAIQDYTRAIFLEPKNPQPYFHRSWTYRRIGKLADADRDRVSAVRLDPNIIQHDVMYPSR